MKEVTRHWLEYAKVDLYTCQKILDDDFLTSIVVFHSQQAVEKCLKAIIDENGLKLPFIHSLVRLCSLVEHILRFPINKEMLKTLDSIYINSRYPADLNISEEGKPTKEEAKELFDFASEFYNQIKLMID